MKVKILSTGNVEEYDESYALRLVDMGYAVKAAEVKAEEPEKKPEPEPETEAPQAEEPKAEEAPKTKTAKSRKK